MLDLETPAFLIDRERLQRNCDSMREKAARSNIIFRPHVKTHKVIDIGLMQHGGKTGPITVSTMAEAEFFADADFTDITYAVPIDPDKLDRAAALAGRVERLNLLIDSTDALHALESHHRTSGESFDVFLKVDCGYHRAGVNPDARESVELARAIGKSKAVRFHGLLTHAGHSYHCRNVDEIRGIANQESDAVTRFREKLGADDLLRSIGSTPTASVVDTFQNTDEVRPGNYVFYDAFQATIGSCRLEDVAVSIFATVIGSYPDRRSIIVDAGALALSKDPGPDHIEPRFGFGVVCDETLQPLPMKLVALSQEHGKIETDVKVPVGTRLRIIPNHSCLTAAMYDVFHVIENGEVVEEWRPTRGW